MIKPHVLLAERPWTQLGEMGGCEILDPNPLHIDLGAMARSLSAQPRFTGHRKLGVPSCSIAQHSVTGADIIYRRTGSAMKAAAFIIHDAHENLLGDIGTPQQTAMGLALQAASERLGLVDASGRPVDMTQIFKGAVASIKDNADATIYSAFGLPWPLTKDVAAAVKQMDLDLLMAEANYYLGEPPWTGGFPDAPLIDLDAELGRPYAPMTADDAAVAFIERVTRFCPADCLAIRLFEDGIDAVMDDPRYAWATGKTFEAAAAPAM